MKKIISILTSLLLIIALLPMETFAETDSTPSWADYTDTTWYDTTATDFTINTPEELAGLSKLLVGPNNFSGKTIKLGRDIDIGAHQWVPIGYSTFTSAKFSGTFDGQGHTVKNININTTNQYQGLFGYTSNATIKNVGIESGTIKGASHCGGIVGCAYCTTISNCYNTSDITTTDSRTGGIAGEIYKSLNDAANSEITNCYNTGIIIATEGTTNEEGGIPKSIGGIAGFVAYGSIKNSYNTGNINAENENYKYVGGIVGATQNQCEKIYYCYNTGTITSEGSTNIGAICGSECAISYCYYTGYNGAIGQYNSKDACDNYYTYPFATLDDSSIKYKETTTVNEPTNYVKSADKLGDNFSFSGVYTSADTKTSVSDKTVTAEGVTEEYDPINDSIINPGTTIKGKITINQPKLTTSGWSTETTQIKADIEMPLYVTKADQVTPYPFEIENKTSNSFTLTTTETRLHNDNDYPTLEYSMDYGQNWESIDYDENQFKVEIKHLDSNKMYVILSRFSSDQNYNASSETMTIIKTKKVPPYIDLPTSYDAVLGDSKCDLDIPANMQQYGEFKWAHPPYTKFNTIGIDTATAKFTPTPENNEIYDWSSLFDSWVASSGEINVNVNVYARVTFDTDGGSAVTQQLTQTKVTKPADPTKNGYAFAGWYKDTTFQNKWDFDTDMVTDNHILYAKWKENPGKKTTTIDSTNGTKIDDFNGLFDTDKLVTDNNKGVTSTDLANNNSVDIKVTVTDKTKDTAEKSSEIITKANGMKVTKFFDITVEKTVSKNNSVLSMTKLTEVPDLLKLTIPLSTELQGKENYSIFRNHNGQIDEITTTPNADCEYIKLSADGKSIELYVKKFSTYAIGYSDKAISGSNTGNIGTTITPSNPSTPEKTENPKTESNIPVSLMILSGLSLAGYVFTKKKIK